MTANSERGEVDLTVGDRTYTLVLKTRGIIALQKRFSTADTIVSIADIFNAALNGSVEHAAAVFWAAFLKYHPDVTFEQAVTIIDDLGGLEAVDAQMAELSKSTNPDPEDVKELEPVTSRPRKARQRGTGEPSTSTLAAAG